jgi:ribosomal protein L12E/L44/L45/RPP1/RPP2
VQNPDKNAIKKVLDSVGAKYDEKRIDTLIAELGGKDLAALIAAGTAPALPLPCPCPAPHPIPSSTASE